MRLILVSLQVFTTDSHIGPIVVVSPELSRGLFLCLLNCPDLHSPGRGCDVFSRLLDEISANGPPIIRCQPDG